MMDFGKSYIDTEAANRVPSLALRFVPFLLLVALSACALFGGAPSYVVFFQERSAQLDAPAQGVIAQAAKRANDRPGSKVEVIGYTDSGGSPPANVALSRQRAQMVADALVANGVAPTLASRADASK